MKVTLNHIRIIGNRRIEYDYSFSDELAKYFSRDRLYVEYDVDISATPGSIAVIPFLANIMPIAWFVGFEVHVEEVDRTFSEALLELKKEFALHFPDMENSTTINSKNLIATSLVENVFAGDHSALLFSGGLDSFESLTRNLDQKPFLVSVHGADIEIEDDRRWAEFKSFNKDEKIVSDHKLFYVTANLRTFYTYNVDLLVDIGWWGKIQHGMALISLIAPLSSVYNIRKILIASSNTGEISFGWGSTAETDEKMQWANQKTVHDGYHLRRTEKIQNIINFARKTGQFIKLRVCYSELRTGFNCSRCSKCQRTMLGFILAGENPNKYGFKVPDDFYSLVFNNFKHSENFTIGIKYEWMCLQEKARYSRNYYFLRDSALESAMIKDFSNLELTLEKEKKNETKFYFLKSKFIFQRKYKNFYRIYLHVRRNLLKI